MPNNFTYEMFTEIANSPNSAFAEIPDELLTNIDTVKAVVNSNPDAYNEYVTGMVTRIGRLYIETPSFIDPFAVVEKGKNEMSHLVQDLHIDPLHAEADFDPAGSTALTRRTTSGVDVAYYQTNYKPRYCLTVDRAGMMDAFRSWDDLDRYWGARMASMYTGRAIDLFNARLYCINKAIADTTDVLPKAYIGTFTARDRAAAQAFIQSVKLVVNSLRFPNTYNVKGVTNVDAVDDLYLVVHKDIQPNLDIYALATFFNVEYADMVKKIITVPSFATVDTGTETANANVLGLVASSKFFQFYETMFTVKPQQNAEGLFDNFFLHPWGVVQVSQFASAVAIVGAENGAAG